MSLIPLFTGKHQRPGVPGEPGFGSLGWKRTEDYITGRFG